MIKKITDGNSANKQLGCNRKSERLPTVQISVEEFAQCHISECVLVYLDGTLGLPVELFPVSRSHRTAAQILHERKNCLDHSH